MVANGAIDSNRAARGRAWQTFALPDETCIVCLEMTLRSSSSVVNAFVTSRDTSGATYASGTDGGSYAQYKVAVGGIAPDEFKTVYACFKARGDTDIGLFANTAGQQIDIVSVRGWYAVDDVKAGDPGDEPGDQPVDQPGDEPVDQPGDEPVDQPGDQREPSVGPNPEPVGDSSSDSSSEQVPADGASTKPIRRPAGKVSALAPIKSPIWWNAHIGRTPVVVRTTAAGEATLVRVCVSPNALTVNEARLAYGRMVKITSIAGGAFKNSNVKGLTLGPNVRSVAARAFANCATLTSVRTGAGVRKVGALAFAHCKSLKSVVLGKRVKSVGASAFKGCKRLKSVKVRSAKLSKASCKRMLAHSKVRSVRLAGMGKALKKQMLATYKKRFPKSVSIR